MRYLINQSINQRSTNFTACADKILLHVSGKSWIFSVKKVILAGIFHWIFDSFDGAEYTDSGIKIRPVRGCAQDTLVVPRVFYDITFRRLKSSIRFSYFPFPFFPRPVARGVLGVWRPPMPKGPHISLCRLHTWSLSVLLAMLHVHYMHKLNLLEVVDKFSKKHPRRMQLDSLLLHWLWYTGIIRLPSTRPNCRSTYLLAV